jgi:hypothetical protein
MKLTQDIVKELLYYNPETGEFIWKTRDIKWFSCEKYQKWWNTRFSGKIAGSQDKNGYTIIKSGGKNYKSHRIVWLYVYGYLPTNQIDHINGNPSDNRIKNLRESTQKENSRNMKIMRNNGVGYKGVSFDKPSNKYRARIRNDSREIFLGNFETPKEAHNAYCKKAQELFGEFWNPGN